MSRNEDVLLLVKDLENDDWQLRNSALLGLVALFREGGEGPAFDCETWRALKLPLQASLKDLRSHLVREACALIGVIAQTCNEDGQPRLEWARDGGRGLLREVVPTLFELVSSGNKVNAKFVDEAIREIIKHSRFKHLVGTLVDFSKGKSNHLREACANYCKCLLLDWTSYLRKHDDLLDAVTACIKQLLADPAAEARAAARGAFHALRREFDDKALRLLSELDARIRGRLAHEKQDSGVTTARKRLAGKPLVKLNDRVLVNKKAATVRFMGETHFASGLWAGVELDVPEGKHDGAVGDTRYFDCAPHRGLFVRPHLLVPLNDYTPKLKRAALVACEHKRFLGDLLDALQSDLADFARIDNSAFSDATADKLTDLASTAPDKFHSIIDTYRTRLHAIPPLDEPQEGMTPDDRVDPPPET